ncbi:MAG: acetamidase/formamidase family protein [Sulfolobales archaeon]|nr:acetamidase/formamidase family protein [Sulfolobales archaeon]MDW8082444.1 acetamidase/formamidase family protein [Sulfolobales archaeon]
MITRLPRDYVIYSFSKLHQAKYTAVPGDIVVFETVDALGGQIVDEATTLDSIDWNRVNPATGPLYVEGAKPGDTLIVEIEDIRISDRAVIVVAPGFGALPDRKIKPMVKMLKVEGRRVLFNDVEIEARPMVGVIGVAPEDGELPTGTSGHHGGNMDVALLTAGSRVYLPVFTEGALLAIGDIHVVQADGEICVAAAEASGEVIVKLELVKGKRPRYPVIETGDRYSIIAFGRDLDEAAYRASEEAVLILMRALSVSFEEAYMLSSLVVDLRINQVVDPMKGVRAEIPKNYVKLEHILTQLS